MPSPGGSQKTLGIFWVADETLKQTGYLAYGHFEQKPVRIKEF